MPKDMSEIKQLPVAIPKAEIAQFCQRHYICKLSLFGSVLRDDFTAESDVDFLVEFEPGKTPGFFKIVSMEMELSELREGRKIDLRTPEELSVYFRDRVMAEAVVQYDSN
jgi:predicted nucleotidyltransferase